jgi:CRP/FNR family cyclic AMP-dependent transcriptional regulator
MDLEKYTHLAFFHGLSISEINLLGPYFSPRSWVAGTVVFEQGDSAEYLYLVVSGEMTIRFKPHDGPVMVVTRIQPGGIFGWSAAIGNPTYTSGAVCKLDSQVICIRGTDLRRLCEKFPEFGKVILDRLSAVIAERQHIQQRQVNSMLANGMRQPTND